MGSVEALEERVLLSMVPLQEATATVSVGGSEVSLAIDSNAATGWATVSVGSDTTASEIAVFETASDINFSATSLAIRMFSGDASGASLGLFRLSVTNDPRSNFADGLATGGDVTANWTTLMPTSATAQVANSSGIPILGIPPTLTIRPDYSILASGPTPNFVLYSIAATTGVTGITGLRLEVIDDDRTALPTGGPGRNARGQFVLRELVLTAQASGTSVGNLVWHDTNGNGVQDSAEPGLGGVPVRLYRSDGTLVDETMTNFNGLYTFSGVAPGNYVFQVEPPPGFFFTTKDQGNDANDSDVDSNGNSDVFAVGTTPDENRDAGLFRLASIHGQKYHDRDVNEDQDAGEEGLDGWLIVIEGFDGAGNPVSVEQETHSMDLDGSGTDGVDNDLDGTIDEPDEAINPQEESGLYWIDVPPGTYTVAEMVEPPWQVSQPTEGVYQLTVSSGESHNGFDFGNYQPGSIHGQKYHDANGNGVKDPGEVGLDGWTITFTTANLDGTYTIAAATTTSIDLDGSGSNGVDDDGDGQVDEPDEAIDPETESGLYSKELKAGNWIVSEVPQAGWKQTAPYNSELLFLFEGVISDLDIDPLAPLAALWNNVQVGDSWSLQYSFDPGAADSDADPSIGGYADAITTYTLTVGGATESGPGAGRSIHVANDLPWDSYGVAPLVQPVGSTEWFLGMLDNSGLTFSSDALTLCGGIDLADFGLKNLELESIGPGGASSMAKGPVLSHQCAPHGSHFVQLSPGAVVYAKDFGNTQPGAIHGQKFHDMNGNGVKDPGEVGLNHWVIGLSGTTAAGDPFLSVQETHIHDVNGDGTLDPETDYGWYWYEDVLPGAYTIQEASKPGWTQTVPATPGGYTLTLGPAQTLDGLNFGNWQPGSIHGQKWHDLNANLDRDFGEPGLNDWKIILKGADEHGNLIEREQLTHCMDLDGSGSNGVDDDGDGAVDEEDEQFDPETECGWYWFENLPAGIYLVEEEQQPGWFETTATGVSHKFAFGGELYRREPIPLEDIEPPLWANAHAGDRWNVLYSFNPTVMDTEPSPVQGSYPAMISYRLEIGGAVAKGLVNAGQAGIGVGDNGAVTGDSYGAGGPSGTFGFGQDRWGLTLYDAPTATFTSDALPVCGDLDFSAFGSADFTTSRSAEIGVLGTVDYYFCGGPGSKTVLLQAGEISDGHDFGNVQFVTFSGQSYHDLNGDGRRDPNEPGLDGWTIKLHDARSGRVVATQRTASVDRDGNGQIDPITEMGSYMFTDLMPGDYMVQEVLPGVMPSGAMDDPHGPFPPQIIPTSGPPGPTPEVPANGYRFVGQGNVAVAVLGDTNGDGFDDLLIGDPSATAAGQSYVVFGGAANLSALDQVDGTDNTIALGNVAAGNGYVITGINAGDGAGGSVRSPGDVNGDGLADLLVFAPAAAAGTGESYLIFGEVGGYNGVLNLADVAAGTIAGFLFDGEAAAAGDVNGDGLADIRFAAHVVFGGQGKLEVLDAADGAYDRRIALAKVPQPGGALGYHFTNVSGHSTVPGDYDGDGFHDLLVGTTVVFGGVMNLHQLDLADGENDGKIDGALVNGTTGVAFTGGAANSAGDINGDGRSDLIFGDRFADLAPPANTNEGRAYVYFGRAPGTWPAGFDVTHLLESNGGDGSLGFVLNGVIEATTGAGTRLGTVVGAAGDVNGDGFDDLFAAGEGDGGSPGETYLLFGHAGPFGVELDAGNLGDAGVVVRGLPGERVRFVHGAGDVNGDGFDDVLIAGALSQSYITFGGDWSMLVSHNGDATGTPDADVMVGTSAANVIVGAGAGDAIRGAAGHDVLAISDLTFRRIVGGRGVDTLRLDGSGHHLNLTTMPDSRIQGIERIDITGNGANTLTMHRRDVLNLSDDSNTVTVIGDSDDALQLFGGFVAAGIEMIGGTAFRVFTRGEAIVRVSDAVSLTIPIASVNASDLLSAAAGDGSAGFVLHGVAAADHSGFAVSSAGDVDGDGFDDLIVGAPEADPSDTLGNPIFDAGQTYVVYGRGNFAAEMDLATLGSDGFVISGLNPFDLSGYSVSSAGDANSDGLDDLLIGVPFGDAQNNAKPDAGEVYLAFGKPVGFGPTLTLNGIDGIPAFGMVDHTGDQVRSAGDVNGDGYADLIVRASGGDSVFGTDTGNYYLVLGGPNLTQLDNADGQVDNQLDLECIVEDTSLSCQTEGVFGFGLSGSTGDVALGLGSISSGGDFNGDGYNDVLIGTGLADGANNMVSDAGEAYVVFGGPHLESLDDAFFTGNPGSIHLASLLPSWVTGDGTHGFVIYGAGMNHRIGQSVSFIGDMNGDGLDDMVIGGPEVPPHGRSYVLFGQAGGLGPELKVADISLGGLGFVIDGPPSGLVVSGLGDINADGFDDLAIGAPLGGANTEGEVYVLFGRSSGFEAVVSLDALDGLNGYRIVGVAANDRFGSAVGGGGDVNGDGFDDIIIGAYLANPTDSSGTPKGDAGQTFVVFGHDHTLSVTHIGDAMGTAGADVMVGDSGDNVLVGGGGSDVLRGGAGDDTLAVSDLTFRRIVGGNGTDTMRLDGSAITLDLTDIPDNRILGIEQIDITGNGSNTLVAGRLDVLNLSDHSNTLVVCGDDGDTVALTGGGWLLAPTMTTTVCGDAHTYQSAAAVVHVRHAVKVITPDPAIFELAELVGEPGIDGYVFRGTKPEHRIGGIAGGSDWDGDGFDDLLIGRAGLACPGTCTSPPPHVDAGSAFFLLGGSSSLSNLDALGDATGNGTISLVSTNSFFFTALGEAVGDRAGSSVALVPDVSGDGTPELLIGANLACPNNPLTAQNECVAESQLGSGKAYLVFGEALTTLGAGGTMFNLSQVRGGNGSFGYEFRGTNAFDTLGDGVAAIGDINGDGRGDLALSAAGGDAPGAGEAGQIVIVFGGKFNHLVPLDDASSDPSDAINGVIKVSNIAAQATAQHGFVLRGAGALDLAGASISPAGDVNGDGVADFIIGAPGVNRDGMEDAGAAYVVFGSLDAFPVAIDLDNLGPRGFSILGAASGDGVGSAVGGGGDVNNDGFDDIVVGAFGVDRDGAGDAGAAYVVFGFNDPNVLAVDLAELSGRGVLLRGAAAGDQAGAAAIVGDWNGDGFDDVAVAAPGADPNFKDDAGKTYVVFGAAHLPGAIELANLNGFNGRIIHGIVAGDRTGGAGPAGDVDGDGFDDLWIAAPLADANGHTNAGEAYLLFGDNFTNLSMQIGDNAANVLTGSAGADAMIGGAGDDVLDGRGGPDVLRGGQGDDTFKITDAQFQKIVGGTGFDTLVLDTSGMFFDLTGVPDNRIQGIEQIDITGQSPNALRLGVRDLLNLPDDGSTLVVLGDGDDQLNLVGADWVYVGSRARGERAFGVYRHGTGTPVAAASLPPIQFGPTAFAGVDPSPWAELLVAAEVAVILDHPEVEWIHTSPERGMQLVSIQAGETPEPLNFGNFQAASISGHVFADRDADGSRDPGEQGLNRWIVQLYDADTGALVAEQPTYYVDLDQDGRLEAARYTFRGLPAGKYYMQQGSHPGWQATLPGLHAPSAVSQVGPSTLSLEVKEFSHSFTTWSDSIVITDPTALDRTFSWETNLNGFSSIRYEVSRLPFPQSLSDPPLTLDAANTIITSTSLFDLDFAPILITSLGTTQVPELPVTFYVRLVARDSEGNYMGQPSNTVAITYVKAPDQVLIFDSMQVRLATIKAIDETDGEAGDSDEIQVKVFVADLSDHSGGHVVAPLHPDLNDMDNGEVVTLDTVLWNYSGPGYHSDHIVILVALLEDDFDDFEAAGAPFHALQDRLAYYQSLSLQPSQTGAFLLQDAEDELNKYAFNLTHDRIGPVHRLHLSSADWEKIIHGQSVAPKKLTFTGDGGQYEVTFEIVAGESGGTGSTQQPLEPGAAPAGAPVASYVVPIQLSGQLVGNLDFGSAPISMVRGRLFEDLDGDGRRDRGEPGLAGQIVALDLDDDGTTDATVLTDAAGQYAFEKLLPGTYAVQPVTRDSEWVYSTVARSALLVEGSLHDGIDFGVFQPATVMGEKYHDRNGNGRRDPHEEGLNGVTIVLQGSDARGNPVRMETLTRSVDLNGNLQFDPDEHGFYRLDGVSPGDYYVFEDFFAPYKPLPALAGIEFGGKIDVVTYSGSVGPSPWTSAVNGAAWSLAYRFDVTADDQNSSNGYGVYHNIAEYSLTIGLNVFSHTESAAADSSTSHILVADDVAHAGGKPLDRYSVWLPLQDSNSISLSLFDKAAAAFGNDALKLCHEFINVSEQVDTGDPNAPSIASGFTAVFDVRTMQAVLDGPAGGVVYGTIDYIDCGDGDDFVLTSGEIADGPDFGNYQVTRLAGKHFEDQNGNGELDADEPGLPGWQIMVVDLASGRVVHHATTGPDGQYAIDDVKPGTYQLKLVEQTGFASSLLPPVEIVVTSGDPPAIDLDFGSYQGARFRGMVFHDPNGDGIKQPTEPVLQNWLIHLDLHSDGTLDQSVQTDDTGQYEFAAVPPGSHAVHQAMHASFKQSFPGAPGFHTVAVTVSGLSFSGLDFGNDGAAPRLETLELASRRFSGICLTFSEPLDPLTITTQTVQLRTVGARPKAVPIARVEFGPDPAKVTLQLRKPAKQGNYELTVSDRATDRSGLHLDGDDDGVAGGDLVRQIGLAKSPSGRVRATVNSRQAIVVDRVLANEPVDLDGPPSAPLEPCCEKPPKRRAVAATERFDHIALGTDLKLPAANHTRAPRAARIDAFSDSRYEAVDTLLEELERTPVA